MQGLLLAGRYRLGESIGRGGMGRVWRAHDEVLHRVVAVKELTAALYAPESERAVLLARTRAEARAAARITHPAVVTVHDVLEHDDRPWIVMELIEGHSLAEAAKERESGRMEPAEVARVGLWVLRALRAAHAAGVLHRDVKPGNVLLARDGRVLLTDFGIAQVEGDTTITKTGEIVGSVDYLAPERVRGADPGPSSDLWALGATLYTAVEGLSPFRRTTPLTTMQAVVDEEPAEPVHAGALGPVITALLRKDPETRPTASEAEQMLAEAAEGRRPSAAQAYVPTRAVAEDEVTAVRRTEPGLAGDGSGSYPGHGSGSYPGHGSGSYPGHSTHPGPGAYPGHPAPPPAAPRRRPRWLLVVSVLVAAALVGGGGALVMRYADGQRGDEGTPLISASDGSGQPTAGPSKEPTGAIPDDWTRVHDAEGFSLALPPGWKRQVFGSQIDYTPDNGDHFLRIAIDENPDFENAYLHQLDLERQLSRLPEYRRKSLRSNFFRDQPGALWEFTWTASEKDPFPGPRRAIEQTYIDGDGVEYALYLSSPAADWETAREQFDAMLRGWRP
ncbi:serine/threonine-protein kinase [Streptomyces sp. NPDC091292]|uniref:serine/threonine-protein kinase n=1 Tax=Streptomyces sp. NPDC091292 TaxID=3365991 RepID=UPI003815CB5D